MHPSSSSANEGTLSTTNGFSDRNLEISSTGPISQFTATSYLEPDLDVTFAERPASLTSWTYADSSSAVAHGSIVRDPSFPGGLRGVQG